MLQFCRDVVKESLESQPDYDSVIRDHPIAALKRIRVLAHNPTRGRYHYACICELLERLLNIQQKDNESVVTYKDTFEQNVEVLKTHLPTSIVDSYVKTTDAYTKLTTDKERQQLKKEEEEKFLTYVLLRHSNQQIFGSLLKKWSAEFAQGRDQYPTGLEEAKDVMAQHMLSNSEQ